jgi:hypothetical protein
MWLLLDNLSENYSGSLLTDRATRLIPLDSVVRLTATRETAGGPEPKSLWDDVMGLDWEKHFRLSSFLLVSLSNHVSSAGLNRSSGGFISLATHSSLKRMYLVSTLVTLLDPPPDPPLDPCHYKGTRIRQTVALCHIIHRYKRMIATDSSTYIHSRGSHHKQSLTNYLNYCVHSSRYVTANYITTRAN